MQVPTFQATDVRPAAHAAGYGLLPSCADHPRAPRLAAAPATGEGSRGWNAPAAGGIGGLRAIGTDGRYRKDQRGRDVASA